MKKPGIIIFITLIYTTVTIGQNDANISKASISSNIKSELVNITELNAGFGLGETSADFAKQFIGLTSIIGYGITKNLQSGIGVGILYFNGGMLVPLFY